MRPLMLQTRSVFVSTAALAIARKVSKESAVYLGLEPCNLDRLIVLDPNGYNTTCMSCVLKSVHADMHHCDTHLPK